MGHAEARGESAPASDGADGVGSFLSDLSVFVTTVNATSRSLAGFVCVLFLNILNILILENPLGPRVGARRRWLKPYNRCVGPCPALAVLMLRHAAHVVVVVVVN